MRIDMKRFLIVLFAGVMSVMSVEASTVNNLTFKDTDIKVVLQAIGQLASREKQINIIAGPNTTGAVTIDLAQVDWETALNVILRTYNLEAYRQKNVIMVNPIGSGGDLGKSEIQVKVFNLKYVDANDANKAIMPILSSSGKTSVLETTGQSGWAFGAEAGKKNEAAKDKLKRTKILIISDTAGRLEQITTLLEQLDTMPKQILIKTRILEVNHNVMRDLGIDWGTGATGAESTTLQPVQMTQNTQYAAHSLAVTPSTFLPQTTGVTAANSGLQFLFKNFNGTEFEAVLHALEETTGTNTLSAPILMTLNNQEATILIGTKYPIIQTEVSSTTNSIVGGSLQEYKDIGIQLNVVPQIWGDKEDYINIIVHPAVSSYATTAKVIDQAGTTLVEYPIISTREAETQLIIPNNGTVMMGGLLKDVITDQVIGIPFLSKIPILGKLFSRTVKGTQKVELVIFITAHIMTPEEQIPSAILDTKKIEDSFTKK